MMIMLGDVMSVFKAVQATSPGTTKFGPFALCASGSRIERWTPRFSEFPKTNSIFSKTIYIYIRIFRIFSVGLLDFDPLGLWTSGL
jgi:hypothetical protein